MTKISLVDTGVWTKRKRSSMGERDHDSGGHKIMYIDDIIGRTLDVMYIRLDWLGGAFVDYQQVCSKLIAGYVSGFSRASVLINKVAFIASVIHEWIFKIGCVLKD